MCLHGDTTRVHDHVHLAMLLQNHRPSVLLVGNVTVDVVDGKNVAVGLWWLVGRATYRVCAYCVHNIVQSHNREVL